MNYAYLVYEEDVEYFIVQFFRKGFSTLDAAMEYVKEKYSIELDTKAIEKGRIRPKFISEWRRVYIWKIRLYDKGS